MTHITLGIIVGALVITLIDTLVRRAFSGRPAGGGGGGQNQQPQQPANTGAAAQQLAQQAQPRDWGFWTLLTISVLGFIAAGLLVKQIQTGALLIVGVTMSSTALVLGITLAIVALFWFNAIGGWPARKFWGTITAIFAAVLLMIASWDLFLRDWCKQMTTSTSPIKEDELFHFFSQNHVGVIAVASVLFLIALWKSKGFQKFAGVAGIVALIGWVVVWGVKEIAIALENGGETRSSLIKTVPGSMQITVGTKGFTEIGWPDGYDWEQAFYGAGGEGQIRPVTIIAIKKGVRKVYRPNDTAILDGLPDGRETTLIKAVAPADIEGNPTFVLTVVTFKVPSEPR